MTGSEPVNQIRASSAGRFTMRGSGDRTPGSRPSLPMRRFWWQRTGTSISRRRQEFWWSHHDNLVDSSVAHLVGIVGIGEELPGKHQSISVAGCDRVGTRLRIGCAAEEQRDIADCPASRR